MKRNGMCPICYLKKLFTRSSRASDLYSNVEYKGGDALTPPMGGRAGTHSKTPSTKI